VAQGQARAVVVDHDVRQLADPRSAARSRPAARRGGAGSSRGRPAGRRRTPRPTSSWIKPLPPGMKPGIQP
jgi:hypothetical protein